MIGYQFIEDLCRAILDKSTAIAGRFHVLPTGAEINADTFEQVLKDLITGSTPTGPRYPCSGMLPPRAFSDYTNPADWDEYTITLLFLKQNAVDSEGQIQDRNPATGTTMHTPVHDWHDMKRCAVSFMRVLGTLARGQQRKWRLASKPQTTVPVSFVGADNAIGCRLDFNLQIFTGCEALEDYTTENQAAITLPTTDTHGEHKL